MTRYIPICLAVWLGSSAPVLGEEFFIRSGEKNLVQFESKAPLESFAGKTNQVHGQLDLDADSLGARMGVYIEVDLASLDTGNGLRNKHMRDSHLETARFPKAIFRGGTIIAPSRARLEPAQEVAFEIEDELELHGVKRILRAPVEMTLSTQGGQPQLHIVSRFEVKLSDHKIPRPKFLMMKLDEVQHVTLDFVAESGALHLAGTKASR